MNRNPMNAPSFQVMFTERLNMPIGLYDTVPEKVHSETLPCWVVNLMNWILRRWFWCDSRMICSSIKRTTVHVDHVGEAISRQQELMAMIYNQRCKDVLMGPRQLHLMEHECQPFMFHYDMRLTGNRGIQYLGVNVHIVPWLDGVIAMPEQFKISSS